MLRENSSDRVGLEYTTCNCVTVRFIRLPIVQSAVKITEISRVSLYNNNVAAEVRKILIMKFKCASMFLHRILTV